MLSKHWTQKKWRQGVCAIRVTIASKQSAHSSTGLSMQAISEMKCHSKYVWYFTKISHPPSCLTFTWLWMKNTGFSWKYPFSLFSSSTSPENPTTTDTAASSNVAKCQQLIQTASQLIERRDGSNSAVVLLKEALQLQENLKVEKQALSVTHYLLGKLCKCAH